MIQNNHALGGNPHPAPYFLKRQVTLVIESTRIMEPINSFEPATYTDAIPAIQVELLPFPHGDPDPSADLILPVPGFQKGFKAGCFDNQLLPLGPDNRRFSDDADNGPFLGIGMVNHMMRREIRCGPGLDGKIAQGKEKNDRPSKSCAPLPQTPANGGDSKDNRPNGPAAVSRKPFTENLAKILAGMDRYIL